MTGRSPLLDPKSSIPLYHQIFVILQNKIRSGEWPAGDPVASEKEICNQFSVSRVTARRALNELAKRGLVTRRQGRGTHVANTEVAPVRASIDSLLEQVGQLGKETSVKLLDLRVMPASADVAAALELPVSTPVQRAIRVRYLGGVSMAYVTTWVPDDIGTRIEGRYGSAKPLLVLLSEVGIAAAKARQTISATVADAEISLALAIPAGAPLIDVCRTVFDENGRAVEYIRIFYRPEMYHFEMTMHRTEGDSGPVWRVGADRDVPTPNR